jgi:hypothetical protein
MKRLHVHVAVDNLKDNIGFYSSMFAAQPTVEKSDYAKWMLDDPRMNFAISQRGASAGLNHLGIQVESDSELNEMQARIETLQPNVEKEEGVACCYAKSDKYWINDPSGIAWETFHSLDTIPVFGEPKATETEKAACCIALAQSKQQTDAPCCVPSAATQPGSACC